MAPPGTRAFNYELQSIILNAPPDSGIFAIFAWDACVFVGEAADICASLLAIYSAADSFSPRVDPTHFSVELVSPASRAQRQEERIRELDPVCNLKVGSPDCRDGRLAHGNPPRGLAGLSRPCAAVIAQQVYSEEPEL